MGNSGYKLMNLCGYLSVSAPNSPGKEYKIYSKEKNCYKYSNSLWIASQIILTVF